MRDTVRHQGGWVASFVIVGVLLAAGLVGSLYVLRLQSASSETPQVAKDDSSKPSADDWKTKEPENKSESSTDKKDKDQTPATSGTTDNDRPSSAATDDDKEQSAPASETPAATETPSEQRHLPSTGPADTVGSILVVALLAFAAVSYLQSRRYVRL